MSVYLVHIISIMVIILLLVYTYLDWIVVYLQNSRYVCNVGNRVIRYREECKAVIVNVNAFFIICKKHYIQRLFCNVLKQCSIAFMEFFKYKKYFYKQGEGLKKYMVSKLTFIIVAVERKHDYEYVIIG